MTFALFVLLAGCACAVGAHRARRRPVLRRFLLAGGGGLFFFLAAEGAARLAQAAVLGDARPRESFHVLTPFTEYGLRPGFRTPGGEVEHNSQGFRRRTEVAREKNGRIRIFLCGGSAAYGTGSSYAWYQPEYQDFANEETIAHFLEVYLAARIDTPVEVINAAAAGYRIEHHLFLLYSRLLAYDPDIVIFYDGFNDVTVLDEDARYNLPAADAVWRYDLANRTSLGNLVRYAVEWAKNQSVLLRQGGAWYRLYRIHRLMERVERAPRPPAPPADAEAVLARTGAGYVFYAGQIASLLRARGVTPVFVIQPALAADTTKPLTDLERKFRRFEENAGLRSLSFFPRHYAAFAAAVGRFCRDHDLPFLDLSQPFAGVTAQTYSDYCHLTPEGNRIVAEAMGRKLLSILKPAAGR